MQEENKTKPGYKTTEFWMTMAANAAALLSGAAGYLPPEKAVLAIAAANGLYALSRGLAKKNT